MTNNRKIRLIQVAKEFKVGLNTITDFLLKKGISLRNVSQLTGTSVNTLRKLRQYA